MNRAAIDIGAGDDVLIIISILEVVKVGPIFSSPSGDDV